MKRTIVLADIKPFGNLESVFLHLDEAIKEVEAEGYTEKVSRLIKAMSQIGLLDTDVWFKEMKSEDKRLEIEMIVLLSHMYLVRLNNIAQKHLNGIDMEPMHIQIGESEVIKQYFKDVEFK